MAGTPDYITPGQPGVATIGSDRTAADENFVPLRDASVSSVRSDQAGRVELTLPARSALIYRASTVIEVPSEPTTIELVRPSEDSNIPTERYRFEAVLGDQRPASVTFAVSIDGGAPVVIGTDDAAPYRIYWNNGTTVHGPAVPTGSEVEIIATVDDASGQLRSDSATAILTKP